MKDSEFIELLNLYLDHEITPADAARLESEVQTNPARRRVYQDYCRMQKACKIIAADFATEEIAAADTDRKVVAFDAEAAESGSSRRGTLIAFGGFAAAAACVALVFAGRHRTGEESSASAAPAYAQATATPVAPARDVQVADAAAPAMAPRGFAPAPQRQHTILVSNPLSLAEQTQAEVRFAAAYRQADNQLAWMETMRLAPLPERKAQETDLQFRAQFPAESRALGGRAVKQGDQAEEMSAFQFLK